MNCNDVKKLLMPYYDGELPPAEATAVTNALADCPDCRSELDELEHIHAFAADAFTAPLAAVDFSGVYSGVMARIAAEDAATSLAPATADTTAAADISGVRVERDGRLVATDGPGLLERFNSWLGELFRLERPWAAMAVAAALLAVVGGVWLSGQDATPTPAGELVAETPKEMRATPRRGAEREVMAASRNMASVTVEQVAEGKVTVLQFDEAEETPLVLWHTVDGEGVPAPTSGSKGL